MTTLSELGLTVRHVIDDDWPILYKWFQDESWYVGNLFLIRLSEQMPHCHFIVAVNQNNKPISFFSYSVFQKFVKICAYMTDANERGKGYGWALWKYMINEIGSDKNYYLKSTEPMTEKYSKIAKFTLMSPVTTNKFVGKAENVLLQSIAAKTSMAEDVFVFHDLSEAAEKDIIEYDATVHGEENADFFHVFLKADKENVRTAYAKNINGKLVGYGSVVQSSIGRRFGPFIAENFDVFVSIFDQLMKEQFPQNEENNQEVIIFNIPSTNSSMIKFVTDAKFQFTFSLDRSFTQRIEDVDFNKLFSFCGLNGNQE